MQKNTEFEIKLSDDYSEVWKKFGTSTENPNTVFTKIINGKRIHKTFPALATKKQVDRLLDSGIEAVIATETAINDSAASDFSVNFYSSFVKIEV